MIITFNELKKDFNSRSSTIANHRLFTQDELKQIDFFINHKDYTPQSNKPFAIIRDRYRPKTDILKLLYR